MEEKQKTYFKSYKISNIQDICKNSPSINNLNDTFEQINHLNAILTHTLPEHLLQFCRIGSIDYDKNHVILFITDQQAYHILRNFSEHIIQSFYSKGFHFDAIITKVANPKPINSIIKSQHNVKLKNYNNNNNSINGITDKANINHTKRKDALIRLAIALGKPEIIIDDNGNCNNNDNDNSGK